jgi:hypothetical protein
MSIQKPMGNIRIIQNDSTSKKNILTTAVDDIDKKAPTNTPSDDLAPHNWINYKTSKQGFYYSATYVEETAKAIYRLIGAYTAAVRPHKNMNNAI